MSLKLTRFLYLFCILIFLVCAPLIIFYSNGWRYDFQKNQITKTGSLSVESFPPGAEVYLNGKLKKQDIFGKLFFYKNIFNTRKIGGLTPVLVKNIIPDDYLVEIKKEGYNIWQKKLTIEKEKITIIKNADLFLSQPKIKLLVEKNIIHQKISPDQKNIAYLAEDGKSINLEVIDLKSEKSTILRQSPFLEPFLSWSPSNKDILIKEKNPASDKENYFVVTLNNPDLILSLGDFLPANQIFSNLKWKNNLIIFGISGKNLYEINIFQKNYQLLYQNNAGDYLINNNDLYRVENIKDQTNLNKIDLSSDRQTLVSILPYSDNYEFLDLGLDLIGLINKNDNFLYLIDPQIKKDKNIILKTNANQYQVDKINNQLIYNNEFEISTFNLDKKKEEIITRYSQKIEKAISYYLGGSIIFNSSQSLYAIEIDKRDKRSFTELLKNSKIDDFIATEIPKFLYLNGELEGKKGLFKVQIQ